jgi:hypothetical protein
MTLAKEHDAGLIDKETYHTRVCKIIKLIKDIGR